MIKRIVACRSQVTTDILSREHHAVIPSRPFTLKNDSARPASLNFIYNPHLIIIQPHAHHARTRWGYPLRLAGKEQLTTGGVDDTEKNCFAAPAKGPRRCRSGPGNRSWFRYFLLINSSHVVPCASSTPAPPTIARTFAKCLSTTLDLASYARILSSSPSNLTPSQTFACIKMLRMNFFYNSHKYTLLRA